MYYLLLIIMFFPVQVIAQEDNPPIISVEGVSNGQVTNQTITPLINIKNPGLNPAEIVLNGKPFISGTSLTDEGDYSLIINVLDQAGNRVSNTIAFTIDKSAPLIDINGMYNHEYTNKPVTPIVNIFDLNLASTEISLNNTTFVSGTIIEEEGDYSLTVNVTDKAGNKNSKKLNFTIDQTPPEIKINGVADGHYYIMPVTPIITVSDRYPLKKSIHLNEENFISGTTLSQEQNYQLTLSAEDKAGNITLLTCHFGIDKSPPLIKISGITEGQYLNNPITPDINIEEPNLASTQILLNNQPYTPGTNISVDGDYQLSVSARDKAGNTAQVFLSFHLDLSPPLVKVTGVEDDKYYADDRIIFVEVTDQNLTGNTITLNDLPFVSGNIATNEGEYHLNISGVDRANNLISKKIIFGIDKTLPVINISGIINGEFRSDYVTPLITITDAHIAEQSLTLNGKSFVNGSTINTEGDHTLEVWVKDKAGNFLKTTREFSIDHSSPSIIITGIKDGEYYREQVIPLIEIKEPHLAVSSISLNGEPFASGTILNNEGEFNLIVSAVDKIGNASNLNYHFVIDRTLPQINIIGLKNGEHYANDLNPIINISDKYLNKSEITLNNEPFLSGTNLSAEGEYLLKVLAEDRAGNTFLQNRKFTIDKTPPHITIGGIKDNEFRSNDLNINIEITDQNLFLQSISLNDKPYLSGTLINIDGDYTLAVRAIDRAKNVNKIIYHFVLDKTPPLISFTGVENNQISSQSLNPRVNISDPHLVTKTLILNNAPWEGNSSLTQEGDYTLSVSALDRAGNVSNLTYLFTIDYAPPRINVTGVEDGLYYNTALKPEISITDTNLSEQSITLNGVLYISGTVISEEGNYLLAIKAQDRVKKTTFLSLTFTLDKTPPRISIGNIKEGDFINEDISLKVNIDDLNLLEKSITLNGTPFDSEKPLSKEEDYLLSVGAKDKANNSQTVNISFALDKTPPEIKIRGVKKGEFSKNKITPLIDIRDLHLLNSQIELNGQPYVSGTPLEQEGDYTLSVSAQDKAENINRENYNFTLDKTQPDLEIAGVKRGEYYRDEVIPQIKINELNLLKKKILINGKDYSSGTPVVEEGVYQLTVEAEDKAGNTARTNLSFTIDKTAPQIKIGNVSNHEFSNDKFNPSVTIEEKNPGSSSIILNNQPFKNGTVLQKEGNYTLSVSAADKAGNHAGLTYLFTLDRTPPQINIQGVEAGKYYNQDLAIIISIKEDNPKVETPNLGVSTTLDGAPYSSGGLIVTEGKHLLEISSEDKAGNRSEESREFFIDKTPPQINISGVKQNEFTNQNLSPEINITDLNLIKSSMTLSKGEVTSPLQTIFKNKTLITQEGSYVLSVNAQDRANNTTSVTINFTIDKTAPQIEIADLPNNQFVNYDVKPTIKINEPNLSEERLLLNNVPFSAGDIISAEGKYILNIMAKDKAGNAQNETYKFIIDKSLPLIEISGVIPDQYSNTDLTPQVSIKDTYLTGQVITLNGLPYVSGKTLSAEKEYTLIVSAEDRAKNINKIVYKFAIDKTLPQIKVSGLNGNNPFLNYKVTPQIEIIEKNLSKQELKLNGDDFKSGTTISADGNYLLTVSAADLAGNTANQSYNFSLDLTPPLVIINGVTDKGFHKKEVIPQVSISDKNLVLQEVMLNGVPYTPQRLSTEMDYTLNALAKDKAGNSVLLNYRFVIDRTPPEIIVSGVVNKEESEFDLTPMIMISEPNLKSSNITLDGAPFISGSTVSAKGNHVLSLVAEDKAGNIAKEKIKFTIK